MSADGSYYSFLPFLRSGIATKIAGGTGKSGRATVPVGLRLRPDGGEPKDVVQDIELYGPGDVIGIDPRAIVRTEPRSWVTNVEPNYLAHIEFYDEDFPWRYSPAGIDPETGRIRPWLALVVLAGGPEPAEGGEFTEGAVTGRPLPFITVSNQGSLPPQEMLGAWAHVHVNGPLAEQVNATDKDAAMARFQDVLRTNPDLACSRVMSPRHLSPSTGYHAFLVPSFEAGRLAGLGIDPSKTPTAQHPSWGVKVAGYDPPEAGNLPYYHRWYFSTGTKGDFEDLVRLLQPREQNPLVARRDVDAHNPPHPLLPGVTTTIPDSPSGVLRLGGALRVIGTKHDAFDDWDKTSFPQPFQRKLADWINLAGDYQASGVAAAHTQYGAAALPAEDDPIITPPLYGRWHALTSRLDVAGANSRKWLHKLNLDPRFRMAANFGTQVVKERQEELMAAAWEQVGDVIAANAKIRAAQLARQVAGRIKAKHLEETMPAARTASRSGRALTLTAPAHPRVTTQVSAGRSLTDAVETVAVGYHLAGSRVAATPVSAPMRRIMRPSRLMRGLDFEHAPPPSELITLMDEGTVVAAPPKTAPGGLTAERLVAQVTQFAVPAAVADDRLQEALADVARSFADAAAGGTAPVRPELGVAATTDAVQAGLNAEDTVPRSLLNSVRLPQRLRPVADQFIEAMAYPVFDEPTYESLLKLSPDIFVPNIGLVEQNSITLLETNQEFIEAYLVGLNHELARELLWREFPTDQRGTPFRQFWDVHTILGEEGEKPEDRRERLYDIPPINEWDPASELGGHDHREATKENEDELVLVIRGDLLKKYPTAAIYAQKAKWELNGTEPDLSRERQLDTEIRTPIYGAKVEPDIYLLGFDLTAQKAKGGPQQPGDPEPGDAGWFFVIKERPGELRFGLDESEAPNVEVWNDLAWGDVDPRHTGFIDVSKDVTVRLIAADDPSDPDVNDDQDKEIQKLDDDALPEWNWQLSSAELAYMLFQVPILMAVHAQEMLR